MRAGEPFRENGDVFVSMGYLHSLDGAEATPPGFQATGAYRQRQAVRQGREGKLTHRAARGLSPPFSTNMPRPVSFLLYSWGNPASDKTISSGS